MNPRLLAVKVLLAVREGSALPEALHHVITDHVPQTTSKLIKALCFGVCRWYWRLAGMADLCLKKPLKLKDHDIYLLILLGLYQLLEMRIPAHAAIAETVSVCVPLGKPWAKGLVNAILREVQRNSATLQSTIQQDESQWQSHPAWLVESYRNDWPEDWQALLTANNEHPPFALRVNQQRVTREGYLAELAPWLAEQGITASAIPETISGIVLSAARDVQELPGFKDGLVSVQDGAAQLAAPWLELAPGQRVLDACAAPGGKAAHILELMPDVQLTAVDHDPQRVQKIVANFARLKMQAHCSTADAADAAAWWDGEQYDRILLDAPCSGSGVIRRHPDIKLLRRATDIAKLAREQFRLLSALWHLLKPGGLLLYVTCSVLHAENSAVVQQFLTEQRDASEETILAPWAKKCPIGLQVLPGMAGMDGFYFARLKKAGGK